MYEAVMRLEEPYQLAVADEDMEKCLNYCRQAITVELHDEYGITITLVVPRFCPFTFINICYTKRDSDPLLN
jgi:hypothetical protein